MSRKKDISLSNLSICPVPFTEKTTFNLVPHIVQKIKIYDVKGALVYQSSGTGTMVWKPSPKLPAGVYIVEISSKDQTKRFNIVRLK